MSVLKIKKLFGLKAILKAASTRKRNRRGLTEKPKSENTVHA
jgi:hypothetical protein